MALVHFVFISVKNMFFYYNQTYYTMKPVELAVYSLDTFTSLFYD